MGDLIETEIEDKKQGKKGVSPQQPKKKRKPFIIIQRFVNNLGENEGFIDCVHFSLRSITLVVHSL